jgi:uncharacterized membrane protein YphA (DoxX/SURF4 family)
MAMTAKCLSDMSSGMLDSLRQQSSTEPTKQSSTTIQLVTKPAIQSTAFRLGRLLYGGILAQLAVDGLRNVDERAQYAEAKNVPMPKLATAVSHWLLLIGGAGIVLWRIPKLAAISVATFLLGVTPMIHNFWTVDEEQKQQEMINFLKNSALLGTALLVLGVAQGEK